MIHVPMYVSRDVAVLPNAALLTFAMVACCCGEQAEVAKSFADASGCEALSAEPVQPDASAVSVAECPATRRVQLVSPEPVQPGGGVPQAPVLLLSSVHGELVDS